MKAATITHHGGMNALKVQDLPKSTNEPGRALVRVKAGGLNHLDIWVRRGLPGLKLQFPHILGCDAAGIVESSEKFSPGEEVIIHPGVSCGQCEPCLRGTESLCRQYKILGEHLPGLHAEWVSVPEENLFKKPTSLRWEEAASIGLVYTTAYQMVERAQVRPGDFVLIHAVGSGVSSAALQLVKQRGAQVAVTAGTDEKVAQGMELGADFGINYRKQDFVSEVKRVFKGGPTVVLDHVGAATWENSLRALAWGGRMVICGATTGKDGITDLAHLFYRQLTLMGSTMGSKRDFPTVLAGFEAGKLKPTVAEVFPLERLSDAHRLLEARQVFGKVVLELP